MQNRTKDHLSNVYTPMHPIGFARQFPDLVRKDADGMRWYPCVAQLPPEHQLVVKPFGGDWYVVAYHDNGEQVERQVLATSRDPAKGRAMRLETAIGVAARILAELGAADDTVRVAHPSIAHIWSCQKLLSQIPGTSPTVL